MRGHDGGRRRLIGVGGACGDGGALAGTGRRPAGRGSGVHLGCRRAHPDRGAGRGRHRLAAVCGEEPAAPDPRPARDGAARPAAPARRRPGLRSAARAGGGLVLLLAAPVAAPDHRRARRHPGHRAVSRPRRRFRPARRRQDARAAPPPPRTLPLVVLDPGHGGRDPGAIGARGTQEKRITLARRHRIEAPLGGGRALPRAADPRARRVRAPCAPDRPGAAAGSGAVPVAARRLGPRRPGCQRLHPVRPPPPTRFPRRWRGGRTRPTGPAGSACPPSRPRWTASCSA